MFMAMAMTSHPSSHPLGNVVGVVVMFVSFTLISYVCTEYGVLSSSTGVSTQYLLRLGAWVMDAGLFVHLHDE